MRSRPWLVLALVGALVGAAAPAFDADERRDVQITAKRTLMSAPPNISVGGGFVSGGELLDGDGRAVVGDGYSHCGVVGVTVAVPPQVTAHCTSVFRLRDGELHLSTLRTYRSLEAGFDETPVAVVGGTGAYANARGEGRATRATPADRAEVAYRFTFTITLD